MLLLIKFWIFKLNPVILLSYLLILVFFLFNYLINIGITDTEEFLKSYFQLLVSPILLLILYDQRNMIKDNLDLIINACVLVMTFFVFLQVGEQYIYGSTNSWFLFDDISISTAENAGRFEAVNLLNYIRPIGQFHEPSYLALVAFLFYVINDSRDNKSRFIEFLTLMTILLSISLTVWSFLFAYFLIVKLRLIRSVIAIILIFVLTSNLEFLDFLRLSEIFEPGTSGWNRIMKPFDEYIYVINNFPLGIPMGNTRFIFDNSFFLFACYFGVLSIPIFSIILILLFIEKIDVRIFIYVMATMFVNGAIITVESFMLIGFLVFSINQSEVSKETAI